MARALTSAFPQQIAPGLRKVYFSTLSKIPQEFRQWANIIPPEGPRKSGAGLNYFDDLLVASLGPFGAKPEGQSIQYDIPVEGSTVRYRPYSFGLGFRITEEMKEDGLYGVMEKMTRELASAAA